MMGRHRTAALCALTVAVAGLCAAQDGVHVLEAFDARRLPGTVEVREAKAKTIRYEGGRALRLRTQAQTSPSVAIEPAREAWDWTVYSGIAVDVVNRGGFPLDLFVRVNSVGVDGERLSNRTHLTVPAGGKRTVRQYFTNHGLGPYWGMRGIPGLGPVLMHGPGLGEGLSLNAAHVTGVRFYLRRPAQDHEFLVDNVRLFEPGSALERAVPMPFVDQFGQYIHDDWAGKLHSEDEMKEAYAAESATLENAAWPADWDQYGGWAGGPQLEATGWFRTEQLDGKWWLVTPEGHLFFSLGVTCVRSGDATFYTGREHWFEWLPEPGGPFSSALGQRKNVHSMAEPINGGGGTVSFYQINLLRRFGGDWRAGSRELAYKRLKAWGFNTLGNWSSGDVCANSPVPFAVSCGTGGAVIEASSGFWGKMTDVYDPSFAGNARRSIAGLTEQYRDNPYCIGYFVDNEQSWKDIPRSVLASPPGQPARKVFIDDLKAKYGGLEKLNAAWGTDCSNWDLLRAPDYPNEVVSEDCDAFEYKFAREYFDTVAAVVREHAPHQLYLGCRFTLAYFPRQVLRACAETADVVSTNLYQPELREGAFPDLGKPYMIGEFHFGSLDTGMFHPGLQSAEDRVDRGRKYTGYVESVAASPLFVGCHWFQYCDQPLTGRFHDGENYNIGLVSGTDIPYPALTGAARACHEQLYRRRYEAK